MNTSLEKNMSRDLVTIRAGDPLSLAYERMNACNIRHLPVRDDFGKVIGILSDRDYSKKFKNTEIDSNARVFDYMSWPVRTLDAKAHLRDAARIMINEKLSSVLITDQGQAIGIMTSEDMLRVLVELLDGHDGEESLRMLLNAELWSVC